MAIPRGWKKAIEAILKQDASLSDKLVKLGQCQEQFRASDNVLNLSLIHI